MKVLLVSTAWPWPTRKGYQLRLLQLVAALRGEHEVTLLLPEPRRGSSASGIPAADSSPPRIEMYRRPRSARPGGVGAALFGGRSLESGLFESADLRRRLGELGARFDVVVLQLVRLSGVMAAMREVPWILDLVDSLSLNLSRRAAFDRFWMRPLLRFEARRLAADERRMIAAATSSLLVSERDRRYLAASLPENLANRLAVVPLALAANPQAAPRAVRTDGAIELAITGNLGYFPTARGIRWFLDDVWPGVARQVPRARLIVAGARPPRGLARRVRSAGGEVVGDPPDLAQILARADLALAPLLAGSGTPIKLLEALAAGVPAVATPAAAEGLDPALARCLAIPEDAVGWVTAIRGLVANPVAARARAEVGRRLVAELHDPVQVARALEGVLRRPQPPR
ncbi:MAG: glycosyltransferase [Thermoanaerobaculia bacterium]